MEKKDIISAVTILRIISILFPGVSGTTTTIYIAGLIFLWYKSKSFKQVLILLIKLELYNLLVMITYTLLILILIPIIDYVGKGTLPDREINNDNFVIAIMTIVFALSLLGSIFWSAIFMIAKIAVMVFLWRVLKHVLS